MDEDRYSQALRDAIQRNVDLINGCGTFVSLYSERMGDFVEGPMPAIQLAIAILLDKPIIVACMPGREPPAKLRAIADAVIYGPADELAEQIAGILQARGEQQ